MTDLKHPPIPTFDPPPPPPSGGGDGGSSVQTPSYKTEEIYSDTPASGQTQVQDQQQQPQAQNEQPVSPETVKQPPQPVPPQLDESPTQAQITTQPQQILEPAPPAPDPTQQVPPEGAGMPSPKRGFPIKLILAIVGTLIFVAAAIVVVMNFLPSSTGIGKRGEIVWWGLANEESVVAPLISEFESKNANVKVKYIKQSPQDYRERLTNSLAAGDGPDIFEIHNTWPVMFKNELSSMPSSIMSQADFAQTFYPVIVSDLTAKDGIVGIPLEFDAITLYINQDVFASAARTEPETWNEVRQLANELTQKDDSGQIIQAGISLGKTKNIDYWQEVIGLMMIQNGVNLNKPAGKLAEDALAFYKLFGEKEAVWSENLPASTKAFATQKLAMYFGPSWQAYEITQDNPNLKFKTILLPQLPKDSASDPDYSYATYWAQGVWEKSTNKELAWEFLKFMSSQDSLSKLNEARTNVGLFERPYPRMDMSLSQIDHPILGSVVTLAPSARSWYLADKTFDGPTGINSQISSLFSELVEGRRGTSLETVSPAIAKILSQYGIVVR
jgi:multiple sugar transport system substrate-binding protein